MNNYKQIYSNIIDSLNKKNSADIPNVIKAFIFAEQKHSGQFRKSGEPYILHPLCVAQILEKLNFDTDVISAAILHDTVEDCGVTTEELGKLFNKQIAEIVDAVTAITKENFMPDMENLFSNTQDFLKLAIEDRTYQKLISMGKNNKSAFYIKFADRLNNLQTISIFPRHKQLAKIIETEKWIIPLAILLKSRFFTLSLKNECFKISYQDEDKFFKYYDRFMQNNLSCNTFHKSYLKQIAENYFSSQKQKSNLENIIIEPKTDLEIFNSICKRFDISSLKRVKESDFHSVSTATIYVVFNSNKTTKQLTSKVFDILTLNGTTEYQLCGLEKDMFDNQFLLVQDKYHNIYSCIGLSTTEYTKITNGTTEGTDIDTIDENSAGEIVTSFINVYTRSNQVLRLPQNSTVLDFAFKIHKDLGFSCKYASINNSPTKVPIYTKLHNGDKVEVFNETTQDGLTKNIATLRWLLYANNESSQKALIKYFEKRYEK